MSTNFVRRRSFARATTDQHLRVGATEVTAEVGESVLLARPAGTTVSCRQPTVVDGANRALPPGSSTRHAAAVHASTSRRNAWASVRMSGWVS